MTTEQFKDFEQNYKTFTGRIADDPKIKYFESGNCKTTFAIPLRKNKDDEAVWLNCEVWGKLAEKVSEMYVKYDDVVVMGYFKETEYDKKKYINFVVKLIG